MRNPESRISALPSGHVASNELGIEASSHIEDSMSINSPSISRTIASEASTLNMRDIREERRVEKALEELCPD